MDDISEIDIPDGWLIQLRLPTIDNIYDRLISNIRWQRSRIIVAGRSVEEPRLTAWYGDEDADYTYSGSKRLPLPWTDDLLEVKAAVEEYAPGSFNSVLLNLYRDGRDSIGFHSDNEPELGENPMIASVSFGGDRTIMFKHKGSRYDDVAVTMEDHDLLIMAGETQKWWRHGINKVKKAEPRINLTFRKIVKSYSR